MSTRSRLSFHLPTLIMKNSQGLTLNLTLTIQPTEKLWIHSLLLTTFSSLKILEMFFSSLHPQSRGSHCNFSHSSHISTVKWLICEHNFPPNQIMQKRNAVLPLLLLDRNRDWKRTEGLACTHRITLCCGFHHSWLVFQNILVFKMSHATHPQIKFRNNSTLPN